MSKFQTKSEEGAASNETRTENSKLTTGTFDMFGRRLVTSSTDGQVKIWNFSNGSSLNEMVSADKKPRVDTEITSLISIYDCNVDCSDAEHYLEDHPKVKNPCFLAAGWDKRLHIWDDPALKKNDGPEQEGGDQNDGKIRCIDLPDPSLPSVHRQDIMSCTFDLTHMLIFTGGVDGTIIGWNFDTKFARYELHKLDETCTSENFIADSKSVDALVVMEKEHLLLSMSADQYLRFWDTDNLQLFQGPVFKMYADHINTLAAD